MRRAALLRHLAADLRDERPSRPTSSSCSSVRAGPLEPGCVRARALNDAIERAFRAVEQRQARRERLVRGLADDQGIAPGIATLGALVERLGTRARSWPSSARSAGCVRRVLQRARRNGALIAAHRRVTGDVLAALLGDRTERDAVGGGVLVDAEV